MKSLAVLAFILCLTHLAWPRDLSSVEINTRKQAAIKKMQARRMSFEMYLAEQEKRATRRESVIDGQKKVRRAYSLKMELARKNYKRIENHYPLDLYKKFVKIREIRKKKLKKARQEYSAMKKELYKIYNNKKYRIDGKKEFKL